MEAYASYLTILRQLTGTLEQLTGLSRKKLAAARADDLDAMNQILKQEQALSLALRSLEQKRLKDSPDLASVPLAELADRCPEAARDEASAVVSDLKSQYRLYQSVSGATRCVLECDLREIERALDNAGGMAMDVMGTQDAELPTQLRTDIRA